MIETKPTKAQTNYRGLATASAIAALFAFALSMNVTPASINEIARYYHASGSMIGWIYRISMSGFFLAVLLSGRISDKYGKLPILLIGCIFMGIGAFLFGNTSSFHMVLFASLLMGIGGGSLEGTAMATVADLYSDSRRTAMLNATQVFYAVGAVVGPLAIARMLLVGSNWRFGYTITVVFSAVAALVTAVAISTRQEKPVAQEHSADWRRVIKNRLVLLLSLGIFLYVGAESGVSSWIAVYFKQSLNTSSAWAAASVSFFWVGIGIGRALTTWTSRRFSDYTIICASLIIAAIFQATLLFLHTPVPALISTLVCGFGMASVWPTILSCAGRAYPNESGTVFGIVVAAGSLGVVLFPPTIGQLADVIGWRSSLWMCFIALMINIVLFVGLRKSYGRRGV